MLKAAVHSIVFALLALPYFGVNAQESGDTDDVTKAYASFYGDGMRHYAEGRNDEAIANFYRAYALKPNRLLLKLIVRTHDFMGHCSAAKRQLVHFREKHPNASAPTLQICRSPGKLALQCVEGVEEVVVDDNLRVPCGKTVELPPGAHELRSADGGPVVLSVVRPDETTTATVGPPSPGERYRKVPLLEDDERYIVIRSPDGLYQLWVRTSLRDDPDMNGTGPGGFSIYQGEDGLYHITSDKLKPVP